MSVLQIVLGKDLERWLVADAREQDRTPARHARYILRCWFIARQHNPPDGGRTGAADEPLR